MEKTAVQKLAAALRVLVTAAFACNLALLPLVPGLVWSSQLGTDLASAAGAAEERAQLAGGLVQGLRLVWSTQYGTVLTLFLLFCGGCTAVILWQARRVLNTILRADTFIMANARNMNRAALCCFLICAAALARTVWGFCYYRSPAPLFTYNALFVPLSLMGGLLCLVMSALFRQAAELKAENDLTI